MYYIQEKSILYYLNLLFEDIYYYIYALTTKEIPFIFLLLLSFTYLLVPLTNIDKQDYISGLSYGAFGMFSAACAFFIPSNYLKSEKEITQLIGALLLFAAPPLYIWFKNFGEIIVVEKSEKSIDYELSHANDKFKEAQDESANEQI